MIPQVILRTMPHTLPRFEQGDEIYDKLKKRHLEVTDPPFDWGGKEWLYWVGDESYLRIALESQLEPRRDFKLVDRMRRT